MRNIWRSSFCLISFRVVRKMQQIVAALPIFILLSFPLLYFAGHSGSDAGSLTGILVLFLGMSGPLIKRITK